MSPNVIFLNPFGKKKTKHKRWAMNFDVRINSKTFLPKKIIQ